MKHIFTFSIILFLIIHSSCISTHNGFIQSPSFSVKNNFKIVSTIEGKSKATYILGIGGNLREGLINEAKKNMYSKYSLNANQNLTNITVDIKRTFFILPLFFMSQNIIVSADVIEFYDNIDEVKVIEKSKIKMSQEIEVSTTENSSNNIEIVKSNSTEEIILDSIKKRVDNNFMKYDSIGEVKIGDIAAYKGSNNETIYGIVFEIGSNNKIKMRTYPSPGQEFIIADKYSWFNKVMN
jgi:hypothetical protein